MEPDEWKSRGLGILNERYDQTLSWLLPDRSRPERLEIAREHLDKCLRRTALLHRSLDRDAVLPTGVELHLFAGDSVPTASEVRLLPGGKLEVAALAAGDGTVTRASALLDEREADSLRWTPRLRSPIHWTSVDFLFTDHFGLTEAPAFTDNALFLLLEAPREWVVDPAIHSPDVRGDRQNGPPMMKKDFMPAQ